MLKIEECTFELVISLVHEIEQERTNVMKTREDLRALAASTQKPMVRERSERPRHERSKPNQTKSMLCYQCKEEGHIATECPKKKKVKCYACGEIGVHIAKDCLRLKKHPTKAAPSKPKIRNRRNKAHLAYDSDQSMTDEEAGEALRAGDRGKSLVILDSGATEHYFNDTNFLSHKEELKGEKTVWCANREKIALKEKGEVCMRLKEGTACVLPEAFAHKDFSSNLLSASKLVLSGNYIILDDISARVISKRLIRRYFLSHLMGNYGE